MLDPKLITFRRNARLDRTRLHETAISLTFAPLPVKMANALFTLLFAIGEGSPADRSGRQTDVPAIAGLFWVLRNSRSPIFEADPQSSLFFLHGLMPAPEVNDALCVHGPNQSLPLE